MALGPGSIAFVGFNADGQDNIAFVATRSNRSGDIIYLTDNEWNGSAFNTGESYTSWTATADVAAGTVVSIDNINNAAIPISTSRPDLGTVAAVAVSGSTNRGFAAGGDTVYAYLAPALTPNLPTTFLAAVASNGFTDTANTGVLNNTGLVAGTTALQFTGGIDLAAFNGLRDNQLSFADYLPIINNPANFTQLNTGNDDSVGNIPFSPNGFVTQVATPPQTVAFAASSVSVSHAEGNAGTTAFTFTVERTGGTTGDVSFSGQLTSAAANAADFNGAACCAVHVQRDDTRRPGFDNRHCPDQWRRHGRARREFHAHLADGLEQRRHGIDFAWRAGNRNRHHSKRRCGRPRKRDRRRHDSRPGAVAAGRRSDADCHQCRPACAAGQFAPAAGTNAEVVSFDPTTDRAYVLNTIGNTIDIVAISASGAASLVSSIDLTTLDGFGGANSVAIKNGILAVAYASDLPGAERFRRLVRRQWHAYQNRRSGSWSRPGGVYR